MQAIQPRFLVAIDPDRTESAEDALLWLLDDLAWQDQLYLDQHPDAPNIYSPRIVGVAGVRHLQYIPQIHEEDWLPIPAMLRDGGGDCKILAAARIAEYRRMGIRARPFIRWRTMPDGALRFHALVKVPEGVEPVRPSWYDDPAGDPRVEDPSVNLGMYRYSEYLGGKFNPRRVIALLQRRAAEEQQKGNSAAAATLRDRAQEVASSAGGRL